MDTCKYCGAIDLEQRPVPPHIGLYCCECGKFQTWIKQSKPETGEVATQNQQDYARHLLNTWAKSKLPMLASEAGAGACQEEGGVKLKRGYILYHHKHGHFGKDYRLTLEIKQSPIVKSYAFNLKSQKDIYDINDCACISYSRAELVKKAKSIRDEWELEILALLEKCQAIEIR